MHATAAACLVFLQATQHPGKPIRSGDASSALCSPHPMPLMVRTLRHLDTGRLSNQSKRGVPEKENPTGLVGAPAGIVLVCSLSSHGRKDSRTCGHMRRVSQQILGCITVNTSHGKAFADRYGGFEVTTNESILIPRCSDAVLPHDFVGARPLTFSPVLGGTSVDQRQMRFRGRNQDTTVRDS